MASPFLLSEFPDSMKGANGIGFLLVLAWLISPVTGTGSAFEFHHLITGKERRLFGYSMGTPFQSLGDVFAHPLSTMNGPAGLFGEAYVEDVVRQTRQGRGEIEVLNTTLNGGGQMRTGVFGKQIRALGLLRVRELVLLYAPDDTTEFQFRHSSRQPLLLMQGNLVGKTLPVGISIRSSLPGFSWPDVSVQAGYRSDTFSARVGSYVMQTTGTLGILALDTDIRVETPVRKTYVHLDMTWTMPFNLTVGGRYARSEITRPSWKGTQTYQMYVSGKRAESGLFCVYEEGAKTWEAGVWATRRIGQGTSDMTVDQSLFGELTHLADTSYSVGVGIKLKRSDFHTLSSYVSYNRWSGRLVGTMATWPFTDAVVDLLGNRSYNKTNGQRTSSQGGLEYEITLPEAAKLRLGARYAVWRTSGMATSWQIELPFIITDLVKRRLNIERVRWVEPAVSVSFNVFAFHIVYSLTQMIPVDVEYRVPAAAPEEREIRGGRFHWLTLTRSL